MCILKLKKTPSRFITLVSVLDSVFYFYMTALINYFNRLILAKALFNASCALFISIPSL